MYTLHYSPGTASMVVHLALLEIGAPFELVEVQVPFDPKKDPSYLALNPRGQVPTLVIDGRPYFESSALLMLLAERHPEAKLAPAAGTPQRAEYYQWLAFLATALGAQYRLWFYPGDLGARAGQPLPGFVRDAVRQKIEDAWTIVDAHLAAGGPWMLGAEFSAVDLLALMYMRWSRNMPRPATQWPALRPFADAMRTRPSWKKLCEAEALTDWAS
ncbi:MAG TPA: glutathione S-transferase family protein [Steroidobacteraceae bacterium]|nr:glutathione S-transferase family protein [Steroidobacteraceae bacterium]